MKRKIAVIVFSMFFCACTSVDTEKDELNVHQVLTDYFTNISQRNWDDLKNLSTDDMIILENGLEWNNDSLINGINKYFSEFNIKYDFEFVKTNIDRNTAWVYYKNSAVAIKDTVKLEFKWLESAYFVKQNKEWKLTFVHSTLLPEFQ